MKRDDNDWMLWRKTPPLVPGWYWVCAAGVWPQVVEFVHKKTGLVPSDRHTQHDEDFWSMCAGPIPDPPAPSMVTRRNK